MPSLARALGESVVISSPWNSIVRELGGKSPEMTLKSVVLPAPFGPRIARLSPCATSRSTSRTAWRPPNRRPIPCKRRIGSACSGAAASVTLGLAGDLRVLRLADPPHAPPHAGRAGTGDVGVEDARRELLELTRRAPEEVADELLPVDRAMSLLVGLQERDETGAADCNEGAVDVRRHLLCIGGVVGRVQRREHPLTYLAAHRAEIADEG